MGCSSLPGEARLTASSNLLRLALAAGMLCGVARAVAAAPAPVQQDGEVGRVRWSVFDEGQGWIPDGVALGADGSTVFAGLWLQNEGLRMFAAGSPLSVLEAQPVLGDSILGAKVAMAAAAPVAVSLTVHQDFVPGGSEIIAAVRSYGLDGDPRPLWEHVLPASQYWTTPGVAVSDDGGVTLAWWSVESLGGMLVIAYDAAGGILSQSVIGDVGILYPEDAFLSRDGKVAFFSLPGLNKALIYDVRAGKEIASLPDNGIFSGHAMSADGRRFAAVSWEFLVGYHVEVYELDDQGLPVLIFERIYPDSVRVTEAALDADGSRFAYSVQEIGPEDSFHLVLQDLDADRTLFERTIAAPGTGLQLWCAALQLDDAGETLACASWGDSFDLTPEIFALDDQGNSLVAVDARGSGLYLSLSRDGELLSAGCKATHSGVFGSGGDLYMIETRAQTLRIEGQPHVGQALDLSVHAEPAFDRMILFAGPELLDPPVGGLSLDPLAGIRVVGAYTLVGGELGTQLPVPASAALANTSVHLQGLLLDDDLGAREPTNKVSLYLLP